MNFKVMDTKVLVRVNNVDIVSTSDEQLIPIKPICQTLGIGYSSQLKKIKEDEILSSTVAVRTTVGADGKNREMCCLSVRYIFGWLFTINPSNVVPEARESVLKYKHLCYDALYDYFTGQQKKVIEQNKIEIALLEELANYNQQRDQINKNINETRKRIEQLRKERLDNDPTLFD